MRLLPRPGWAKENPLFWVNSGFVVISALLIVWPGPIMATGPSDLPLRLWGMLLQLIGVVTVWHDLTGTARIFGIIGFMESTLAWLKSYSRRDAVIGAMGTTLGVSGTNARAKQRAPIQPNAPLSDRVKNLEANVSFIDTDLDGAFREIDTRAAHLEAKIKSESAERVQAIRGVKDSIKETATGNVATLAFGAVWLAIGIFLATIAPEIAKLRAGQWREVWFELWGSTF